MKTLRLKQDEAYERQVLRDKLTHRQQIKALTFRPGESKREVARLRALEPSKSI